MQQAVTIPVTVKCRIGVDDHDSYEALVHFIRTVAKAGCQTFIIHARKAWLSGLSPKQNRDIPPLRYDVVYQLKQEMPELDIILNGGITCLDQAESLLKQVDGVMIGREAYHRPYLLAEVDARFFGVQEPPVSREEILQRLMPYVQRQLKAQVRLNSVTRHILGLFHGEQGARLWRRHLSENVGKPGVDETLLYYPSLL